MVLWKSLKDPKKDRQSIDLRLASKPQLVEEIIERQPQASYWLEASDVFQYFRVGSHLDSGLTLESSGGEAIRLERTVRHHRHDQPAAFPVCLCRAHSADPCEIDKAWPP